MPPKKNKKVKKLDDESHKILPVLKETEKEHLLKAELETLTHQLDGLKEHVKGLREENKWLDKEAHESRAESHEYMTYMTKKATKRQNNIVAMSDQNQQEIRMINERREQLLSDYENTKKVLKGSLIQKATELAKTRKDLEELDEYKKLQVVQISKIAELQKEVQQIRIKHVNTIQNIKTKFISEKLQYETESNTKIEMIGKQANKEARQCLTRHTNTIKDENRKLRRELVSLIKQSRILQKHKDALQTEQKDLLLEQEYAGDLKRLRSQRKLAGTSKTLVVQAMATEEHQLSTEDLFARLGIRQAAEEAPSPGIIEHTA